MTFVIHLRVLDQIDSKRHAHYLLNRLKINMICYHDQRYRLKYYFTTRLFNLI